MFSKLKRPLSDNPDFFLIQDNLFARLRSNCEGNIFEDEAIRQLVFTAENSRRNSVILHSKDGGREWVTVIIKDLALRFCPGGKASLMIEVYGLNYQTQKAHPIFSSTKLRGPGMLEIEELMPFYAGSFCFAMTSVPSQLTSEERQKHFISSGQPVIRNVFRLLSAALIQRAYGAIRPSFYQKLQGLQATVEAEEHRDLRLTYGR